MIFWAAAAVLAAATAGLVLLRAARNAASAASSQPEGDAAAGYRRQIDEIDQLSSAGLLAASERASAVAEAGRRLLLARRAPAEDKPIPAASRRWVLTAAAATTILAFLIYGSVGGPGQPDQPYAQRLEQWRAGDLRSLDPARLSALLAVVARRQPNNASLQLYLGKLRLSAEDYHGAADSLRKAARLAPNDPQAQRLLGEALVRAAGDGKTPPQAEAAFRRAVALDPQDAASHYFLAEAAFGRGDLPAAKAGWLRAKALLPDDDPRRAFVDQRISQAQQADALASSLSGSIDDMVGGLAERLKQNPQDANGWARLVRSYGVLGRSEDQKQAVAAARRALAGDPSAIAKVEAEAGPRR